MKTQKLISLCLILTLLASLLCLPAAAAEGSDWDALSAALEKGGEVKLSADVTAPAERMRILEVPAGVTAALDLNGFTLDGGTPGEEDCVILVRGSLTLTDSSAAGTGRITGTRDAVDVIGGDFTLAGGTLDGCGNNGAAAAEGGRLTMTGGAVRGSRQIGVLVTGEGSAATISGGEISGSVGYYEDGWFYHGTGLQAEYGATAEITGGVISGNVFGAKAIEAALTFSGGAVRDSYEVPLPDQEGTYGGTGLYAYHGAIRMTGGSVSGNTWAGLYIDDGSVAEVSGGEIVSGGEAAVYVLGGEMHFNGGALSGGPKNAVWVNGGAVTMTDGTISDFDWSGVHLNAGSFEMTGGEMIDNACGILAEGGSAAMRGGAIRGSGAFGLLLLDGALALSGSPVFGNDDSLDLALASGLTLTVDGPLALAKPLVVGSYALNDDHGAEAVLTTGLPGNGSAEDFVYVTEAYEIAAGADGEAKAVYIRYFPDVTNTDWYASGVAYAASKGIFEGTDKGFEPDMLMTNAMAVQALWNHAGKPAGGTALPYADAAADAWYSDALRWAVETGVADAEASAFAPDAPITRERFVLLCYRYIQTLGEGFEGLWAFPLDFPDAGAVSEDALEAVSWCVMNEVIIGMGDGTLAPGGVLTRAQAATILMRLFYLLG